MQRGEPFPRGVIFPSNSCYEPYIISKELHSFGVHRHTHTHTHLDALAHSHKGMHTQLSTNFLSVFLSLSHTHTHTHSVLAALLSPCQYPAI